MRDSDEDGVADRFDQCPREREDRDGFRDGDGCPDNDNDKDGLIDEKDHCPDAAEDTDAFMDDDGCPDLDNDKDGVPDAQDACPNDTSQGSGKTHPNGCPLIQIHGKKLTIASAIRFKSDSAQLPESARDTLKEIVSFMNARPIADRLRVEGYTDLWGSALQNQRLGEQRANAVKQMLVHLGLDHTRIEAFGRATKAPIGDGKAPNSAKQSRRVEFYLSLSERK
jgi:outer membrane protein OmpA-like peptidoglycan-associated protein